MDAQGLAYFAAGIGAGLTIIGGAGGIGRLAAAAMDGISRQPGSAGDIRGAMIVAAGLIEGATFFALIVTMMLALMAPPAGSAMTGAASEALTAPVTASPSPTTEAVR